MNIELRPCSFKFNQLDAFVFYKKCSQLEKRGRDCLWSPSSESNFICISSSSKLHTHTHTQMFVWQQLSVYSAQSPPRLPDVERSTSCCRRQCWHWMQAEVGTAEGWLCRDVDVVRLCLPALWKALLWGCEGEKPRNPLEASFQLALREGHAFPVVAVLIYSVILGNQVCAAVTDCATAPLQLEAGTNGKSLRPKEVVICFHNPSLLWPVYKWRMSFVASKISRLPDRGFW